MSNQPVLANPVTHNFSAIQTALNSGKLNSDNYSASGVYSQNIVSNAILSQHFSMPSNVSGAKLASSIITHNNLILTGASCPSMVTMGAAASKMPAGGVKIAILTQSLVLTTETNTVTFNYSNAVYGQPSFTAPPTPLGHPIFLFATGSGFFGVDKVKYQNVSASSCTVHIVANEISASETMTMQIALMGPM